MKIENRKLRCTYEDLEETVQRTDFLGYGFELCTRFGHFFGKLISSSMAVIFKVHRELSEWSNTDLNTFRKKRGFCTYLRLVEGLILFWLLECGRGRVDDGPAQRGTL